MKKLTESQILKGCLDLLSHHPKVAMAWRNNSGALQTGNRFVRFGLPGSSDIIGILKGGQFLSVEVKRPGKRPTELQKAFMVSVSRAGGVAIWVDSVEGLKRDLDGLP